MSIETGHSKPERREFEPLPIVPYEKYREICDAAQPEVYRVTGITNAEKYEASKTDDRTKYIEIEGKRLPLITPVEHAGGYNVEGCHSLTGSKQVYILTLPPRFLEVAEVDTASMLAECEEGASIIVETSSEYTAEFKETLSSDLEGKWQVGEFIDPKCLKGNRTAQMRVYVAHLESLSDDGTGEIPYRDLPYEELFEEEVRENGPTSTEFVSAARIREDPELFKQLWDLHNDRFEWLGEHHPISMQESKDFFQEVISDDYTKSYVRFEYDENGERVPVCHGCSLDGLDHADWLNSTFRERILQASMEAGENVEFFYGIMSKIAPAGQRYAQDVMGLNSRLVRRNGEKLLIVFESTNLSSMYIPALVKRYLGGEPKGVKIVGGIEKVASMDYWFLKSGVNETV